MSNASFERVRNPPRRQFLVAFKWTLKPGQSTISNHCPLETETPPRDSVKSGLRSKIMLGLKPLKPGRQARYKKATIYKLTKQKLKRKTYLLSNDFPNFPTLRSWRVGVRLITEWIDVSALQPSGHVTDHTETYFPANIIQICAQPLNHRIRKVNSGKSFYILPTN